MIDLTDALTILGLKQAPCEIRMERTHLRFYELGAYFEAGDDRWIELNPQNHLRFLGYDPQNILIHELVHASRSHFEDSFWEELLAYQTAKHGYQKFLGPLLSSKIAQYLIFSMPLVALISPLFPYSALIFIFSWCLLVFKQMRQYQLLKRVYDYFANEGLRKKEAFQKMILLSARELEALAKKSTSRVWDF